MSFSSMANDIISLIKPDGTVIEGIKANVQPTMIMIFDDKIPLEENDKIYRKLPSSLVEKYIVLDRGYYAAFHGIQGHYQAKVKKDGSINEEKYKSITTVYNVNGSNSRININSTDNSRNYINNPNQLFEDLKKTILEIQEAEIKNKSLEILEELILTQNTPSYLSKYQNFIGTLSNHMTVIAPFVPALTQLIQ